MRLVGYSRGARENPCAIINGFLSERGLESVPVFSDAENEFRSLRTVQNAVKRELCDAVILPSYDDLGDDKYSRLENELFFIRNGIKLIYIERHKVDAKRAIVIAAKRFSSYVTDWDESFGISMPEFGNAQPENSNIPFGYKVKDGEAAVDPTESECVRTIFGSYIAGKSIAEILRIIPDAVSKRGKLFSNMTVKTVLKNRHYLGMRTKKGILLPPVIKYSTWLKAKERIEREYGGEPTLEPYFKKVASDRPPNYFRTVKGSGVSGLSVDSDAFEKAIEREISAISSDRQIYSIVIEYVERELDEARSVYSDAVKTNNRITGEFRKALRRVSDGDYSEETQNTLERLADEKTFSAMRLRRIRSETELFSIDPDELMAFLSRAERINELSIEEKAFITDAFVRYVRIRSGKVIMRIFDPGAGRYVTKELDGIL